MQNIGSSAEGAAQALHTSLCSLDGCEIAIEDALEADPSQLGREDLGALNLLCAPNLPGSEHLDVAKCLARLDRLTAFVKAGTERNRHRFASDARFGHSEPMWRMAMLVTLVKRDFGAAYNPTARDELLAGIESPITDSRDVFIHGYSTSVLTIAGAPAHRSPSWSPPSRAACGIPSDWR